MDDMLLQRLAKAGSWSGDCDGADEHDQEEETIRTRYGNGGPYRFYSSITTGLL